MQSIHWFIIDDYANLLLLGNFAKFSKRILAFKWWKIELIFAAVIYGLSLTKFSLIPMKLRIFFRIQTLYSMMRFLIKFCFVKWMWTWPFQVELLNDCLCRMRISTISSKSIVSKKWITYWESGYLNWLRYLRGGGNSNTYNF